MGNEQNKQPKSQGYIGVLLVIGITIVLAKACGSGGGTPLDPCAKYSGDDRTICQFNYVNKYEEDHKK